MQKNRDLESIKNKLMAHDEERQTLMEARRTRAEQQENQIQDNDPVLAQEGRGFWKSIFRWA